MESFSLVPGFCPVCGTIFPPIKSTGNIDCYNCQKSFAPDVFGEMELEYTIHFNTYEKKKTQTEVKQEMQEADGPIVERKCPKCGHEKMSYATLQLRSADEGQTVFFTCIQCNELYVIIMDIIIQTEMLPSNEVSIPLAEALNKRKSELFDNELFNASVFLDPRIKVCLDSDQTLSREICIKRFKESENS